MLLYPFPPLIIRRLTFYHVSVGPYVLEDRFVAQKLAFYFEAVPPVSKE